MLFNSNWTYDFLVNDEIERKEPKIKKALEKGGVLEIIWKINLGSWSLKMTQLRHFRFLYLKKNTFDTHVYLYYFLVSG